MPARVPARPAALPAGLGTLRTLAEQAFSRTAGAPLTGVNRVRVLRDAAENYPAWTDAMREARHSIHLEMYIFHRDTVGRRFVALLAEKAREGVAVRGGHHCAQVLMERFNVVGTSRASFALYNTMDDVDALVNAVGVARKVFG